MFKIEELSGSLIKSGRFRDAIIPFISELDKAHAQGVITSGESKMLHRAFCELLLIPDASSATILGDKMLALSLRMPPIEVAEFHRNVEDSRK